MSAWNPNSSTQSIIITRHPAESPEVFGFLPGLILKDTASGCNPVSKIVLRTSTGTGINHSPFSSGGPQGCRPYRFDRPHRKRRQGRAGILAKKAAQQPHQSCLCAVRILAQEDPSCGGAARHPAKPSGPDAKGHRHPGETGGLALRQETGQHFHVQTTGSTGTPLKVFVCEQNGYYNIVRSLAQIFFDDLPLDENRVQITPVLRTEELQKKTGLQSVELHWAGPLSKVYRNGSNKKLRFNKDIDGLVAELTKDSVGYLVCHSRVLEQLLDHGGVDLIKRLGVKVWIHLSDYRSRDVVEQLKQIGIPTLSNYSSGETGPIAFECTKNEGYYHVAHTNVIVECDQSLTTTFDGEVVGRLLITHLHSYATPLIRYDIGDFGKLHDQCPCGHNGPTISHIYGRGKHFLRHPDGSYLPFYLSTRVLREAVEFSECRFRQETIDTITVQIGGRETLSPEEEEKLRAIIIAVTDPVFKVVIRPVNEIDWSDNPKQLFFSSAVV